MRIMAIVLAGLASVSVVACQSEPEFDEKFEQRSSELTAKARQIEADAKLQLDAAREAERAAAEMGDAEVGGAEVGATLPVSSAPAAPPASDPAASVR